MSDSIELRCSGLPITTACVASIVPPQVHIERDLPEARLGTAVHEIMAAVVEPAGDFVVDLEAALDAVPAYARIHRVEMDGLALLVLNAFRCWERLKDRFPMPAAETYMVEPLPCHSCLDPAVCWCGVPRAKLTGHADILALSEDGESVVIGDFKTGHADADPVQLQGYGWLGLQRYPTASRVRACLIRVRDQSADWHTWTRDELDAWAKDLRESLSRTEVYRPGKHCFSGETRFLTDNGIRCLADACGENVRVLNRFGSWEGADIRSFGVQKLLQITLDDGTKIRATPSHLWWMMEPKRHGGWQMTNSRVTSREITHVPIACFHEQPEIDADGVRHGIVFGDGYRRTNRNYTIVRLQPKKAELARWFSNSPMLVEHLPGQFQNHVPVKPRTCGIVDVTLQPAHYKKLPGRCSPEYARGFIAGLVATDGTVSKGGWIRLHCEGEQKAIQIAEIARLGGIVVSSVKMESDEWPHVMPGGKITSGRKRQLMAIRLAPKTCPVIRSDHRARLKPVNQLRRLYREVVSIEESGEEEVFCAVVPGTESFTLASGVVTSNCGFCPRGHECPAKTALLQQAAAWLPGVPSMTIPTDELAKGALLATALQQVKQLETACEKAREMIRAEVVAAGGTLTADDGMELAIVHQERRGILPCPESAQILASYIPESERWATIEYRKGKVEEAVKAAAPPRKGAAMIREIYDRLEGVGAITTTTVERLELRRSLPTITHDPKEPQP